MPPCASAKEAFDLVSTTLTEVEDTFTSIVDNPSSWKTDGRLYPPRADSRRAVAGHDDIARYRSRRHNTWIAQNGAIKIAEGEITCLEKPGFDGRTITAMMAKGTSAP